MSKRLEELREVKLALGTLIRVLEDIFAANEKPIKETLQKAKHALKQISKIETALKNYEEPTNKPVILYGRTHGHTQALVDTICKNYKEVKITNLEDEKKLKALEIVKECKKVIYLRKKYDEELYTPEEIEEEGGQRYYLEDGGDGYICYELTKEKFDLLQEVLL